MASSTEYTDPLYDPTTGQPSQANLDTKPLDPSDPNFDPNVNNPLNTWGSGPDAQPTSTYAGWTWDPYMYRYQKDPAAPTTPPPTGGPNPPPPAAPSGNTPVAPPAQPSGGPAIPPGSPSSYLPPDPNAAPAPTPPSVSQPDSGQNAFGQSIRSALVKALGQPDVTADDPSIAPAIAANRVASQRMLAQQRDAIAERLNAQGLTGSGALDQQMAQAFENSATQQGQFAGSAVLDQAKARRQELVNLMQTGAGILNADDAQAVQAKIADLDAFLRQQSITNQNNQANDQMGLQGAYYSALLQQQQIRDMLGV